MGGITMWIARDKNGLLYGFENKPIRDEHVWIPANGWTVDFPSSAFPEVKWEDEEPRELMLK